MHHRRRGPVDHSDDNQGREGNSTLSQGPQQESRRKKGDTGSKRDDDKGDTLGEKIGSVEGEVSLLDL